MALKTTGAGKSIVYPTFGFGRDRHILLYNFDIDSERLKLDHKTILEAQVIPLLSQGGRITLRGMSSRTGSNRYNHELSLKRAKTVKSYLMMADPVAAQAYITKGVGEKSAKKAGQSDGIEDEVYRSVLLVVSSDYVPRILPEKPLYPQPQHPDWQRGEFSIHVETLDILLYKKMSGELYLSHGVCRSYIVWNLSISNLNASLGTKGKPPIDIGNLKAVGIPFSYDLKLIDPSFFWRDKSVRLKFHSKKISITIVNALPRMVGASYQPFKGSGISISGRNVSFTMTSNSGVLGLVEGVGSIEKPKNKARPDNCV